jgi:hypothetical protein
MYTAATIPQPPAKSHCVFCCQMCTAFAGLATCVSAPSQSTGIASLNICRCPPRSRCVVAVHLQDWWCVCQPLFDQLCDAANIFNYPTRSRCLFCCAFAGLAMCVSALSQSTGIATKLQPTFNLPLKAKRILLCKHTATDFAGPAMCVSVPFQSTGIAAKPHGTTAHKASPTNAPSLRSCLTRRLASSLVNVSSLTLVRPSWQCRMKCWRWRLRGVTTCQSGTISYRCGGGGTCFSCAWCDQLLSSVVEVMSIGKACSCQE